LGVSSQISGAGFRRGGGGAGAVGKCGAASELQPEPIGTVAAADLAGNRLRVRTSARGDVARMDTSLRAARAASAGRSAREAFGGQCANAGPAFGAAAGVRGRPLADQARD